MLDANKYMSQINAVLKKESNQIIYVTTGKSASTLIESFTKGKIDTKNIFFIDCTTKNSIAEPKKGLNKIINLQSPESLTAMSLAITECVKKIRGKNITIVMDSLSSLLIYNEEMIVSQFMNFLVNKVRSMEVNLYLLAINGNAEKYAIQQISTTVDEIKKMN